MCMLLQIVLIHLSLGDYSKKHTKFWTYYVQIVGRQGISQPYFFQKKVWTKTFEEGRSDMDVHTYKKVWGGDNFKYA